MKDTTSLPMSWMSPATVPMTTLPCLAACVALAASFGFTRSPIAFIISPAMMSSGRKYSFSSKRLPTMVIASLAASRMHLGILALVQHLLDQAHRLVFVHVGDRSDQFFLHCR